LAQFIRGLYHELFRHGKLEKTYHALAEVNQPPRENHWTVENRIVRGEPRFRMKTVPGVANACSHIQLREVKGNRGLFRLQPVTGKTHQLRLHMSGLGFRIINDRVYPDLQPERDDDFNAPLQLLAKQVRFHDPVSGQNREFRSEQGLLW
jgi:tRNA pseudouridine32 synthase/23S rRNA pseudouridine746 synthase